MHSWQNNKTAIFFDVDDTLYDHLAPFRQAVEEIAAPSASFSYEEAYHRLRYYSDILSLELGGACAMEAGAATEGMRRRRFQLALAEFGIELTAEKASAMQAAYMDCQYQIELFPGARELIEQLSEAGHLVGLITNGAGEHQQKKIDALELDSLIPPHRQFISGNCGWDKPDKRLFEHVNAKTGTVAEQCVYIGDSWRNDVIGASNAGWTSVWFNHRAAKPEPEPKSESDHQPDHQPDHIVRDYESLRRLLLDC